MGIIHFENRVNNVLTDVTSAVLADADDVYGVRRNDNAAIVVAAGTAMSHVSTGIYRYTFTDPAPNLIYQYAVRIVYGGVTYQFLPQLTGQIEPTTSVAAVPYPLTSQAEIERLYSTAGVDLRVDDLTTNQQADLWNEVVGAATETIESYTWNRYYTVDLRNSQWVRRRATILGAYYLSIRRANPGQFVPDYENVMGDLDRLIGAGGMPATQIPNVPVIASDQPCVSSYRVDDRYRYDKLRVASWQSTNPYAGQPTFYNLPGELG